MTIEKLHNCPNCGGTLQNDGRCRFCGSKIYDFVTVETDKYGRPKPLYFRIKDHEGKVMTVPIVITSYNTKIESQSLRCDNLLGDSTYISGPPLITGELDFEVIGNPIYDKEE